MSYFRFLKEGVMRSQVMISIVYSRWAIAGLVALGFQVGTSAHAQVACNLLQPTEIESVLREWAAGGKAKPFSGAIDNSSGITLDTCRSEIVKSQGNLQVTVVLVKNLPLAGEDAIRTRNVALARERQWKMEGEKFEEKTVGKAHCTLYGRPGIPAHSVCTIPHAKGYVEVELIAPTQKEIPSMGAVGTLVQKANSGLC